MKEATAMNARHLHTVGYSRRAVVNRIFAAAYACAIIALLHRHSLSILHSASVPSVFLLVADLLLAFAWSTTQSFRMRPVARRRQFLDRLSEVLTGGERDFPALDIFICTADPYKEPPMSVVNTALSVMAYDYPTEKVSVYVSDDGGSQLTLFAFMEAAKFGRLWLPFCRRHNVVERSPDAYFSSSYPSCAETDNIKLMYQTIKMKVENVVEHGKVGDEYIECETERVAFSQWTSDFTPHHHPPVIQVLLEKGKDIDVSGVSMPNLIYVSRQKSKTSPHNFKAGALNALVRVSAVMTNAPIVLTLDCDMYSNDPQTPRRALCYFADPSIAPELAYVQFPQQFHGLNENDIYASEFKRLFVSNPIGMDGLSGPSYVGTGCFFSRRAFFGSPSSFLSPEIPQLSPGHPPHKPLSCPEILDLARRVAGCNYETKTRWGNQTGFRYGSLVEDFYTGYKLQCEGWKSVFCHPERPAFLGDIPISLYEVLGQTKRWAVGLLEVAFSKFCPLTFGYRTMGLLMCLSYAHYAFWSILAIPIIIYSFLPQLCLMTGLTIFPKVSDPNFHLYVFLFVGAYGQDCLDFLLHKGTLRRWWSDQRMWLTRGLTSYPSGLAEYFCKQLGISTKGFIVTSKILDEEQSKRYDQGIFDFSVPLPMFVPLTMAAIINLAAFLVGLRRVFRGTNFQESFIELFLAGFGILNCLPIYEAMILRIDKGRMPIKIMILSSFLAWTLYVLACLSLRE